MSRAVVLVVMVLLATGCRREQKAPVEVKNSDEIAKAVLDPQKIYITTSAENDERVQRAFPGGVASEDAHATIGSAPAPPEDEAPDPRSAVLVEVDLAPAVDLATVRAAVKTKPDGVATFVKGLTTGGKWQFVEDDTATGPFEHVTVEVSFVDIDHPAAAATVQTEIAWARTSLGKLGKPTVSMTAAQALAKATAAFELHKTLTDDAVDVGVVIAAPQGKKFPGRLVWDVVYSAGFRWGDGDYFHWVPSPSTDISQGIGMGTSTGTGYFMPESVAKGDADVADLEMSFDVARTWQPEAMFDVMVRAAKYMAGRLGGTVVDHDGRPFDETAARARVTSIVKQMAAADLTPGTGLALQIF